MTPRPTWRPLTKGERTKLLAFLGVLFFAGNFFLVDKALRFRSDLRHRQAVLRAEQADAGVWLGQKDLWMQRSAWLDEHQIQAEADKQADVQLLESLQKSASEQKIVIAEQSLKESRKTAFYREVSVQLRVSGSLESFCRWMASLQQPTRFQSVPQFSLKGGDEKDPGKVQCTLTIARDYAIGGAPARGGTP